MKRVPFLPLSERSAKKISRYFLGVGEGLSKMFPTMDFNLEQSDMDFDAREWLGLSFFIAIVWGFILFDIVFLVVLVTQKVFTFALGVAFLVGLAIAAAIFFYSSLLPRVRVKKKIRQIEHNIPHVLNQLLVEVRSGVTVFNAMNSIVSAGYGRLSEEFSKAVVDIQTGSSEVDALERLAVNNPSLFLRRVIWQLVNAMKSGADIGTILKEIVDNITAEQKTAIKKYGSELNPLSLFYMMLVVIFPTLGIVFLLVMFSFVGIAMSIEFVLIGILVGLVFIQVMFLGLIKNKRPVGL